MSWPSENRLHTIGITGQKGKENSLWSIILQVTIHDSAAEHDDLISKSLRYLSITGDLIVSCGIADERPLIAHTRYIFKESRCLQYSGPWILTPKINMIGYFAGEPECQSAPRHGFAEIGFITIL